MVSFFTDITFRLRNLLQTREREDSNIVIIFDLTLTTASRSHQQLVRNEMHRILRYFFKPEMYVVLPFSFIFAPLVDYCDIHFATVFIEEVKSSSLKNLLLFLVPFFLSLYKQDTPV